MVREVLSGRLIIGKEITYQLRHVQRLAGAFARREYAIREDDHVCAGPHHNLVNDRFRAGVDADRVARRVDHVQSLWLPDQHRTVTVAREDDRATAEIYGDDVQGGRDLAPAMEVQVVVSCPRCGPVSHTLGEQRDHLASHHIADGFRCPAAQLAVSQNKGEPTIWALYQLESVTALAGRVLLDLGHANTNFHETASPRPQPGILSPSPFDKLRVMALRQTQGDGPSTGSG